MNEVSDREAIALLRWSHTRFFVCGKAYGEWARRILVGEYAAQVGGHSLTRVGDPAPEGLDEVLEEVGLLFTPRTSVDVCDEPPRGGSHLFSVRFYIRFHKLRHPRDMGRAVILPRTLETLLHEQCPHPHGAEAAGRSPHPLQSHPMFAARPFALNMTTATSAGVAVRAISTKTTTIKG